MKLTKIKIGIIIFCIKSLVLGEKRGRRNDFTRTGLAKSSWQRQNFTFFSFKYIFFLVDKKWKKWSSVSSLASIKSGRLEKRWVGLGHPVGGVSWLLDRTSERSRPAATPEPRWRPGPAPRAASLPVPTAVSCLIKINKPITINYFDNCTTATL